MGTTATLHALRPTRDESPTGGRCAHHSAHCQTCGLRELCLPAGLEGAELAQLDGIVSRKRPLKRGAHLYRSGDPLRSLFAVRTGFLKSSVLHDDGREQVTGFHMMGELLGLDAIGSGRHVGDAMALEDCEICEIPFGMLEQLSREIPALQQHLHRIMSREITRDSGV
jgi:CRP/FNR family transcriptional regulator